MLKIGQFKGGIMSHPVPGMEYFCQECLEEIIDFHKCD